jgi:hypothetical protein
LRRILAAKWERKKKQRGYEKRREEKKLSQGKYCTSMKKEEKNIGIM